MEPAVGERIRGQYELTAQLGTGGFSTVWRARDHNHERDVALKLPRFEKHDRQTVIERFVQERDLLAPFSERLAHSTVVRYLDGDIETEPRFLAFQLLEGDTLTEAFSTNALGSGVRRRLAIELAETLDFLHRNNIVYLDLKPENVVVRRSGRPVLLDFNTAVRTSTEVDTAFEPDQYKPPELLGHSQGVPVGPQADVYSWGKLAFYLLTGANVETEDVPPEGLDPRTFGSSCSEGLAAVVQQATMPAAQDRYQDGVELTGALAAESGRTPRLRLQHPTGVDCTVADGDTVGRYVTDGPTPWIVLPDAGGHIARQHFDIEQTPEGWQLVDTSTNGTYVARDDSWTFLLSQNGYEIQREQGTLDSNRAPPSTMTLRDGDVIAPVHPEYGVQLRVKTE
jgi:serine/threonine protein kinase